MTVAQILNGHATRRCIDANGLTFEIFEAGAGDHLALLLHGFPEHAHAWRHQVPHLADLGYRVWAMNMRGYGASSRPVAMRDYAIEALLEDVAAVAARAQARSVTLIGHDWGAIVAWFLAMRRPASVTRLVIMNVPHPAAMLRELRHGWAQRRRSWYVLFFQIPWLPERLMALNHARPVADAFLDTCNDRSAFTDADLQIFRDNAAAPGALRAMIHYYRAMVRGGGMRRQERLGFPVIDTPTLMLWGEDDIALTRAVTFDTQRWVANLTLRYFPGVSHWIQQEAPAAVNEALGAWLPAVRPPDTPLSGAGAGQSRARASSARS